MIYTHWLGLAPLMFMLAIAAVIDARFRRIPNWLTITMLLSGLAQSFTSLHLARPSMAVLGIAAGFAIMLGQFVLGGLGGGDVKLMMGVGAWLGPVPLLAVFAAASVVGMIIVLSQAAWQGRLIKLLDNCCVVLVNLVHLKHVGVEHAIETGKLCRSVDKPLPYAVPVLLATLLVVGLQGVL
jgi:prepilin peptidase CpaA